MTDEHNEESSHRGLSGGRSGGEGYSYQDIYTAYQLGRLLTVRQSVALEEVYWEKKVLDLAPNVGTIPVIIDDLVLRETDNRLTFVQAKKHVEGGRWTVRRLIDAGVVMQFWQQWQIIPESLRRDARLRLITADEIGRIPDLLASVQIARTWNELLSGASQEVLSDIRMWTAALGDSLGNVEVLLQSLKAIEVCVVNDPFADLRRELRSDLYASDDIARHLVHIVIAGKDRSHKALGSHTRESLLRQLEKEGVDRGPLWSLSRTWKDDVFRVVLDLASRQAQENWEASIERSIYVPREEPETRMQTLLGEDVPWISLEGEAGTGKSTLLHKLFSGLVQKATNGADFLPLFVDTIWLLEASDINHSPIAAIASFLPAHVTNVLEGLLLLAEIFEAASKRLVLFVDTVDAAILTSSRARMIQWLTVDAHQSGIQIISGCRPLEAQLCFPKLYGQSKQRRTVLLNDFTRPETEMAIDLYAARYYSQLSAATRQQAQETLHSYLSNTQFEDVCRRPVTLRMVFEAYDDRPPSEAVNRYRLFEDYWRKKVRGDRVERRFRASRKARLELVKDFSLTLMRMNAIKLPAGDFEQFTDRHPEGAEARDDLLSESVLLEERAASTCHFSFFHQSFLEYVIARAILESDNDQYQAFIESVLAPLKSGPRTPWFALLEELAIHSQRYVNRRSTAGDILRDLLNSSIPGALSSAAMVWCQIGSATDSLKLDTRTATDLYFRHACLQHLHNADASRLSALLDEFAKPAWESGDIRQRLTALKAWARVAPLNPASVQAQLLSLNVEAIVLRHSPEDIARPMVDELGRIYAAFLGVDDQFVGVHLQPWYERLLREFKSTAKRATLVLDVGARLRITPKASDLLYGWIKLPESCRNRHFRHLRDAFGETLGKHQPGLDQLEQERDWILNPTPGTDVRNRVLAVWRQRIINGLWKADSPLWQLFLDAQEHSLIGEISGMAIHPLAQAGNPELFHCLVDYLAQGDRNQANPTNALRFQHVVSALQEFVTDPERARYTLKQSGLGERPIRTLSPREYGLVIQCATNLPKEESHGIITRILAEDNSSSFLNLPSGLVEDLPIQLSLESLGKKLNANQQMRVARHLAKHADQLTNAWVERAARWLLDVIVQGPSMAKLPALEAMPGILGRIDDVPLVLHVIDVLRGLWRRYKRDGDAAAIGNCIAALLSLVAIAPELASGFNADSLEMLNRPRHLWRETRKSALRVLCALFAPMGPDANRTADSINAIRMLTDHNENHLPIDELILAIRILFRLSQFDPHSAWRQTAEIAFLVGMGGYGTLAQRNLAAACRGVIQNCLTDSSTREQIIESLPSLPDIFQTEVIRESMKRNDDTLLGRYNGQELSDRAQKVLQTWGKVRSARELTRKGIDTNSPSNE